MEESENKSSGDRRSDAERRQAAQQTAKTLLPLLPEPEQALAIFNLILPYLPRSLRPEDLSVLLKTARSGRSVRISVVDFIGAILSSEENPTDEIIGFYDFMSERVMIPKIFQQNKHLLTRLKKRY